MTRDKSPGIVEESIVPLRTGLEENRRETILSWYGRVYICRRIETVCAIRIEIDRARTVYEGDNVRNVSVAIFVGNSSTNDVPGYAPQLEGIGNTAAYEGAPAYERCRHTVPRQECGAILGKRN